MTTATDKVFDYECSGDDWSEFIEAMHSGRPVRITEEMYWYWLEVLPPVYMGKTITLPSGEVVKAHFGFAEGAEPVTAFYKTAGQYLCCRTEQMNPHA